jgi:hypothetical protein
MAQMQFGRDAGTETESARSREQTSNLCNHGVNGEISRFVESYCSRSCQVAVKRIAWGVFFLQTMKSQLISGDGPSWTK